jgi:GPH family glycoside/pentoside/hexuronide:cation symporter
MKSGGKLAFGIKLSYGVGDIANNVFIVTAGMYLLFFLTNEVQVSPALAGIALLFPKLWDVVSDPMMGLITDRTKSRFGRRRPYLLFGAVPFGLSFVFLFIIPRYTSETLRAIHVALMYALGCTAFTVVNVPYSSMVAEMTDDYNERMSLTSFRMIFASAGALAAGALVLPLVQIGGGGQRGYLAMSLLYGLIIVASCLVCFWGTRRAKALPAAEQPTPFREQVKIAVRNFPFLMLIASYFAQALAIGVMMAGFVYYVKYAMKLPETAMDLVYPLFLVTAIVFIPVWVKVGRRLGKIRAYSIGLALFCLLIFSLFFTPASLLSLFYIQVFVLGVGFSSFQLFPFSMLPDTIEYDELQSGLRREGVFSGLWSGGQKIAYSLGPPLVGLALSRSGFVMAGAQPASVELGIRLIFCLFPAVAVLLSFIPFSRYNLTEARFEEIKRRIAEKR